MRNLEELIELAKNIFPELSELPNERFSIPSSTIFGSVANHNNFLEVVQGSGRHRWLKFIDLPDKNYENPEENSASATYSGDDDEELDKVQTSILDLTTNYVLNNIFNFNKSSDFQLKYDKEKRILVSSASQIYSKGKPLEYLDFKNKDPLSYYEDNYDSDEEDSNKEKPLLQDPDSIIRKYFLYKSVAGIDDYTTRNVQYYKQNDSIKAYQFDGRLEGLNYQQFIDSITSRDWLEDLEERISISVDKALEGDNLEEYKELHGINKNYIKSKTFDTMIVLTALQKLVALKDQYIETIAKLVDSPNYHNVEQASTDLSKQYQLNDPKIFPFSELNSYLLTITQRFDLLVDVINKRTTRWNAKNPDSPIPTYAEQQLAKKQYREQIEAQNTTHTFSNISITASPTDTEVDIAKAIFTKMKENT